MVKIALTVLGLIFGFGIGIRYANHLVREQRMTTPLPITAVAEPPPAECVDRLFRLARLSAAWIDTLSILKAENDSLRRTRP